MRAKPRPSQPSPSQAGPSQAASPALPARETPVHSGGGHVGQLHELIEARLGTAPFGPTTVLPGERFVQTVSRSVGWALLGGCYLAAAAYLLG